MIVLCDIDGVICDWTKSILRCYANAGGRGYENWVSSSWTDLFERLPDQDVLRKVALYDPSLFREMDLEHPDSLEALKYLNAEYTVRLVTSIPAMHIPHRWAWFQENAPFITYDQMIFCTDKRYVRGDALIDDNVDYLYNWLEVNDRGAGILINRPWNNNGWRDKLVDFGPRVDYHNSLMDVVDSIIIA